MLRVLELEHVHISKLPNEVSSLFNLHYLGLRNTKVERLPNNIQKLQSLQTLDLRYSRIRKLPRGVTQLKQLRHLILYRPCKVEFGGCVPTLEEAWLFKNLQTLKGVEITKKLVQRLGDMKELRSLKVRQIQAAHCPQLCTALIKLTNLRNLLLDTIGIEEQLHLEMLNSAPLPVQKLCLWGRLFRGEMPRFICSWTELTSVKLRRSHLIEDPLPSLGQLPNLMVLLMDRAFDGQTLHFKTGWFLNLKRLHLDSLKNLNNIVIEEGAMINLHKLIMIELEELKMVPSGIKFLTHLQHIVLSKLSDELMEKLKKKDGNEDLQRIKHISNITIY